MTSQQQQQPPSSSSPPPPPQKKEDFSSLVGLRGEVKWVVEKKHLASELGSGDVQVFGTPSLVALFEAAAVSSLNSFFSLLNSSSSSSSPLTSVGTTVNISHLAATPLSCNVRAEATVTEVRGRKVSFSIVAFDDAEKVGEGTHERIIVEKKRFQNKADSKRAKPNL